jgi:hypothetical protein
LHGRLLRPKPESVPDDSVVGYRYTDIANRRILGIVISGLLSQHVIIAVLREAKSAAEHEEEDQMETIVTHAMQRRVFCFLS